MISELKNAIAKAEQLPENEQKQIAQLILDEVNHKVNKGLYTKNSKFFVLNIKR